MYQKSTTKSILLHSNNITLKRKKHESLNTSTTITKYSSAAAAAVG